MVKANELRIKNKVLLRGSMSDVVGIECNYDDWPIVPTIHLMDERAGHAYVEEDGCDPVPITPKILEKSGFEKGVRGFSIDDAVSWNDNRIIIYCDHGEKLYSIDCKYLHQLQNFHYTWYGEELKINL